MQDYLQQIAQQIVLYFFGFSGVFAVLAMFFPNVKGQPLFKRREIGTDIAYYFFASFIYAFVSTALIASILSLIGSMRDTHNGVIGLFPALASMPVWLQIAMVLLISDVLQYWLHRWFHMARLWKFHAIHHSARDIDWLTSYRFHPVNVLLYATSVSVLLAIMGFSVQAFTIVAPLSMVHSTLTHANLNWTFGPLRHVIASPVFHRWHHTMAEEGRDKNFAPTFPFLDILFGTYYMPSGVQPSQYGVTEDVPHGFVDQFFYPFRKNAK